MRERRAGGRRERPVERLIAELRPGRAALLERGAGLDAVALHALAASAEGERRVRVLLTAPEPRPDAGAPGGPAAMDALLDALGEDNRAALAARHLDLDVLRRLCAAPGGPVFVRGLVAPATSRDGEPVERPGPPGVRRLVTAWASILAGAVAGVALCMGVGTLIGGVAFLFGIAYLIFGLTVLALKVPWTRGHGPAAATMAVAFAVLVVVASFSVSGWYLAVRGVPATVTVVSPQYYREGGGNVPRCRIRYADGTLRRVASDDAGCATREVGRRITVMSDPAGWFSPHIGTAADLNLGSTVTVAGAAGGLLVLAPSVVVALAIADRRRARRRAA